MRHGVYTNSMIDDDDFDDLPEEPPERDAERRKFAERLLPELIKRMVEAGVGKLSEGPENLRNFVHELRVPKEIANYLFAQIDETKNGLYRVVAREIRDFLEHTNLAEEITNALTKLSFEIKTEIRFIPNDAPSRLFPRPEVKAEVKVVDDDKAKAGAVRTQAPAPAVPKREERPRRRAR